MRNYTVWMQDDDNRISNYSISAYNSDQAISMALVLHPDLRVLDCIDERMSVVNH